MDLTKFYIPDDEREWAKSPFNLGRRTIATDARVLITIPIENKYPSGEKYKIADAVRGLMSLHSQQKYQTHNFRFNTLGEFCEVCKGVGKMDYKPCVECEQEGVLYFKTRYSDYEVECKTCHGEGVKTYPSHTGKKVCDYCHGNGLIFPQYKINNLYFNYHLIQKIAGLEGIKIALNSDKHMLYFKADNDIKGILMSMVKVNDV